MENKLTYTKVGDYYIPNLAIKPTPSVTAAEGVLFKSIVAIMLIFWYY